MQANNSNTKLNLKPRVTISTLQSFLDLMRSYPSLLKIPSFAPITGFFQQLQAQKSPGCSSCGKRKQVQANRNVFEACLTKLTEADKAQIKTILGTHEVCFYSVGADNRLNLVCF